MKIKTIDDIRKLTSQDILDLFKEKSISNNIK
jgi:hypothetical protein